MCESTSDPQDIYGWAGAATWDVAAAYIASVKVTMITDPESAGHDTWVSENVPNRDYVPPALYPAPAGLGSDHDENGVVDIMDVLLVVQHWGTSGTNGDANSDGIVDVTDLLLAIHEFGLGAG